MKARSLNQTEHFQYNDLLPPFIFPTRDGEFSLGAPLFECRWFDFGYNLVLIQQLRVAWIEHLQRGCTTPRC